MEAEVVRAAAGVVEAEVVRVEAVRAAGVVEAGVARVEEVEIEEAGVGAERDCKKKLGHSEIKLCSVQIW